MSKTFNVVLVRDLKQYATISVDADTANGAVNRALDIQPDSVSWHDRDISIHHYESVHEQHAPDPEPKGEEKNITTKIYTYDVELDVSYDGGDLVSSCFISKVRDGTTYCSSLALLEDQGTIEGDNWGDVIQVPDRVIKKIYGWAEDNGY